MDRALVLNASYQPICVVTARRAVVLVLKEKADVLLERPSLIRGATLAIGRMELRTRPGQPARAPPAATGTGGSLRPSPPQRRPRRCPGTAPTLARCGRPR